MCRTLSLSLSLLLFVVRLYAYCQQRLDLHVPSHLHVGQPPVQPSSCFWSGDVDTVNCSVYPSPPQTCVAGRMCAKVLGICFCPSFSVSVCWILLSGTIWVRWCRQQSSSPSVLVCSWVGRGCSCGSTGSRFEANSSNDGGELPGCCISWFSCGACRRMSSEAVSRALQYLHKLGLPPQKWRLLYFRSHFGLSFELGTRCVAVDRISKATMARDGGEYPCKDFCRHGFLSNTTKAFLC